MQCCCGLHEIVQFGGLRGIVSMPSIKSKVDNLIFDSPFSSSSDKLHRLTRLPTCRAGLLDLTPEREKH